MDFWPPELELLRSTRVWEGLTSEERARVIATLARLIIKALHPEDVNKIQEKKHEP
jgi:uncharacterized circularly permuted ATP-grasp superfamily protein